MRVLIACEFSGVVREAFTRRGHEAWSCDLEPTDTPGNHFQADIFQVLALDLQWDLMIAHPPCTYLCNSGVRWLKGSPERQANMESAAGFFRSLLECDIPRIAVENPIMHKYAVEIIGRRQNQVIQPWQYGHGETKATCLWLKDLPELSPTDIVDGREGRIHKLPPSKDRWKLRSITYTGIAEAMAQQWGDIV